MRTGSPPRFWPQFSGARCLTKWFKFQGVPSNKRRYWLVFNQGDADLCVKDPGFEVDLTVSSHLRTMVQIWLGHETITEALRRGHLELAGAPGVVKTFRKWFVLSLFAPSGRTPPGRPAAA